MRTGSHLRSGTALSSSTSRSGAGPTSLRDASAVAELFFGVFRRDLAAFYPQFQVLGDLERAGPFDLANGPGFQIQVAPDSSLSVELFGIRHRIEVPDGLRYSSHDLRMIRAIGAVLSLRYQHLFQINHTSRLELYRGGSEDHYVAAFVEPWAYASTSSRPSRIASTIHTLRTAALSTYENRRVSTGALLLGNEDSALETPADALAYGVELTSLKSIHRLCDGKRTLFLVDRAGKLVEVIDVDHWAQSAGARDLPDVPCARDYSAHARATRSDGNVCLVLSPNQEIKLFAEGSLAFAFAHGRWRILDPVDKFAVWGRAVGEPRLARVLFQTALDLAESRQGGLFVVIDQPEVAIGRLIAPFDLLSDEILEGPPVGLTSGDPLAKRALHYLGRGRSVLDLDPTVLEAFAGLDGAIVTDRSSRLLAFGAILRHDALASISAVAEGARTTAAMIASQYGPVLKVSEDGVVSCYLEGRRVWDL
jgi:hypothetical protein